MHVMTEDETIEACRTQSIARFGDGELRVAIGGACSSQRKNDALARELRHILRNQTSGLLVGIPNFENNAKRANWDKYRGPAFARHFRDGSTYASAFITRPDSAPWIDRPEYWGKVRDLWHDRDVVLVVGDRKSLTPEMLEGAASVRVVEGPRQHAYDEVDAIEEQIGTPSGLVVMCLGCTATALAARLHTKGVHALDLGHIGMFMKHAGSYVAPSTLISKAYRKQNVELHRRPEGFGGDGKKHAERILEYARTLGARSICDYGCGEGTLKKAIVPLGWSGFFCEYDPAMPGRDQLPKPVQFIACTDVLEHIEPDFLENVMRHQFNVTELGGFFTIATRPANKILPDGRNAHLIQESPQWWVDKMKSVGWQIVETFEKTKDGKCREVWLWVKKPMPASTGAPT